MAQINGNTTGAKALLLTVQYPPQRTVEAVTGTTALGKASALFAGVAVYVRSDIFLLTVVIYCLTAVLDWYLGRRLAHREKRFDSEQATFKMGLKVSLLAQVGVVWLIGTQVVQYFGGEWGGALAAIVMALVTLDELDSVESNRVALGGHPIPGWSTIIHKLRGATDHLNLLDDEGD